MKLPSFKKEKDNEPKVTMSSLELYSTLLLNKSRKGIGIEEKNKPNNYIQLEYDRIISNRHKKYYIIESLTSEIDLYLFDVIRGLVPNDVYVNFQSFIYPHTINFKSRKMTNRTRIWKNKSKKNKGKKEEEFSTNEEKMESVRDTWIRLSWDYLQDAVARKRETISTGTFLEISCEIKDIEEDKKFKESCEKILNYFFQEGISVSPIESSLYDFLVANSPTSFGEGVIFKENVTRRVSTDEIFVKLFKIANGVLSKKGYLWGINVLTGEPVFKEIARDNESKEICILASPQGGGKSGFFKTFGALCHGQGMDGIYLDYEGDEYDEWAKVLDGNLLKLGAYDGSYFDSLEISELTGIDDIDRTLKEESKQTTFRVFFELLDGMNSIKQRLFNDALNKLYDKWGITDDPRTWVNSKNIKFKNLYEEICALQADDYDIDIGQDLAEMKSTLFLYFDERGLYGRWFLNPIPLARMMPKRDKVNVLIISFSMQGRTVSSDDQKKEVSIKQMTFSYLISLICNINKTMGKFTLVGIEELPRYSMNEGSSQTIKDLALGIRKRNGVLFALTNNPMEMCSKGQEGGVIKPQYKAIMSNANVKLIGVLDPADVDTICDSFAMGPAREAMHHMAANPGKYQFCFMAYIDNNFAIVKMPIPQSLTKSKLYATRTRNVKGDKNEET